MNLHSLLLYFIFVSIKNLLGDLNTGALLLNSDGHKKGFGPILTKSIWKLSLFTVKYSR